MAEKKSVEKIRHVQFLKSPTGKYGLGYAVGNEAPIKMDDEKYNEMIETGYIKPINPVETANMLLDQKKAELAKAEAELKEAEAEQKKAAQSKNK